jgi:glycosyltransferase involved in cell wall biosynthesis
MLSGISSVLFVASSLSGGVESHFAVLAAELERRGIRCGAFGLQGRPERLAGACSLGVHIGRCRELPRLLAGRRYDRVHATTGVLMFPPIVYALRVLLGLDRVVLACHGSLPVDTSLMPGATLVAVSTAAAAAMRGVGERAVTVIPNSTDTELFHPSDDVAPATTAADHRMRLLWVGRTLEPDWPCKDVWGALFLALHSGNRVHLTLVDTSNRASDLGLRDWLRGRVDYRVGLPAGQMARLYREIAADGGALIFTSRNEGMSMTLFEAWASGLPVVAPRCPGFEVVRDGIDALLYDRHDGLDGIVACLDRLRDAGLRQALARAGLERVRGEFSARRMADQYVSVYERPGGSAPVLPPLRWLARAVVRGAGPVLARNHSI